MPLLTPNIENRVRKLPKPSNSTQALQPLFEAVSNSAFALEDLFGVDVDRGRVEVIINNLADPDRIEVIVQDTGIGLDSSRYSAFCEIDTDFKQARGGKGVGRLFWLDAFSKIHVVSVYNEDIKMLQRSFDFVLSNNEQIVSHFEDREIEYSTNGTTIRFSGLRTKEYVETFPRRIDTFLRYFSAHFIADFLLGRGPTIIVNLDGDLTRYPDAVKELTIGSPMEMTFDHNLYGTIKITGFTCKPESSTGLDGRHQLHLLGDSRTVESRKVDNLIGAHSLSRDGHEDLVFHGCVSSEYLNTRVTEGRTAFTLPERVLKDICRACMDAVKEILLPDQIEKYEKLRRESYIAFVERYPIFGFDTDAVQLSRVPFHATAAEEFASGLIKYQIRSEESRQRSLQTLIDALDLENSPIDLEKSVVTAARDIQASEQLALAQHVVRRKLALELLEKLIRRIRLRNNQDDDHHLERTLHEFICPMQIIGDNGAERKSRAHDLWIVDERLTFTRAFSSDKRLDAILSHGGSADRPDLLVWDLAYGLGVTDPESPDAADVSEPLRSMMIVEFKKPGRTNYPKAEDNIEHQITKYLSQLKGGDIETFDRARVRIADDCIFHCYVVADIKGDLELQLSTWETTSNGQGRIRALKGKYRGQIEVIQWPDLISDAWLRNRANLHVAGLRRNKALKLEGKIEQRSPDDEQSEEDSSDE